MSRVADLVDGVAEATIVGSFTRLGFAARSRLEDWEGLAPDALTGRTIVVTGGTSGLGLAASRALVEAGASVAIVGRNPDKTRRIRDELRTLGRTEDVHAVIADMGELDDVRRAAHEILEHHPHLDTLVHNAGALSAERTTNRSGIESTVASQVVGPFLLTGLLLDRLAEADHARVVTMSSGGMYTSPLRVDGLEMSPADYAGSEQYARAKRAQVTLNEMWPDHAPPNVHFHALHPGWADTPGVRESLPTFRRIVGPLLRTPEEGADTLLWLIAENEATESNGGFWHDRRRRGIHRLPRTRRSDTPQRRRELWDRVVAESGYDPG